MCKNWKVISVDIFIHPIFICNKKPDLNPHVQEKLSSLTWKWWKIFHHYDQLKNKPKTHHYLNGVQKRWEMTVEYHRVVTPYLEHWASDFSANKLFISWYCDIYHAPRQIIKLPPKLLSRRARAKSTESLPFQWILSIRKEFLLVKKDNTIRF